MIKKDIIFEEIEHIGKRNKLIAPYTVVGHSSIFWQDVLDVLHAHYDMDKVKLITINYRDGATYICFCYRIEKANKEYMISFDAFHAK